VVDVKSIPIVRQRRKSYCLHVKRDGQVEIIAPPDVPEDTLRSFAAQHIKWIENQIARKTQVSDEDYKLVEDILEIAEVIRKPTYRTITGSVSKKDGSVRITAPVTATDQDIRDYVLNYRNWFEKYSEILRAKSTAGKDVFTAEELNNMLLKAKEFIPKRVEYWAPIVGVDYKEIAIKFYVGKWGSCDNRGNLTFNPLLMLCPSEAVDSVIVHELCHRMHLNHSSKFYEEVLRVMPNYWEIRRWIITKGAALVNKLRESKLPIQIYNV